MNGIKYENRFKLNDQIGNWTVINEKIIRSKSNNSAKILVKCKCGFEKLAYCDLLLKGRSTQCFSCGHGDKKGENSVRYTGYKELPGRWFSRLKKKKFDLKITIKDVYKLWIKQDKKCALTGLPIDFQNQNVGTSDLVCTASLDRIDSNKGYIKGNIQLVHKDVNIMKNSYPQERFIEICKLVSEWNKDKFTKKTDSKKWRTSTISNI